MNAVRNFQKMNNLDESLKNLKQMLQDQREICLQWQNQEHEAQADTEERSHQKAARSNDLLNNILEISTEAEDLRMNIRMPKPGKLSSSNITTCCY